MIFHIVANPIRALTIEPTQEDAADSHSDIVSKAIEKAGAFQTNVRRPDAQRFARVLFHRKDIVGGNGKFATFALEWQGTSTRRNEEA
jgi:hypothetical protein